MRPSLSLSMLGLAALLVAAPAGAAELEETRLEAAAMQATRDGDFDRAAKAWFELSEKALSEPIKLRAELELARTFARRGLHGAALRQYAYVIEAGPNHPHYLRAVEGLVASAAALHEEDVTGAILDREYAEELSRLPSDSLHEINYLVGLVSYRKNKREEAMDFLASVPPGAPAFARSHYLLGVLNARNGEHPEAVAAFESILALTAAPEDPARDELRQLARLGLARVYFGMGRYADAVRQYDQVPRYSEWWDEALFENGWARFLDDDWGGALGSLQALHAPQFEGSFQPESWILKATVYYYACLYDDAKQALGAFEKIYLPMQQTVEALLKTERSNEGWYRLLGAESSGLPPAIRSLLAANRRLVRFQKSVDSLGHEIETVRAVHAWQGTRLQAELIDGLGQSRSLALQLAGAFVKRRLDDAAKTIAGFDGQKEILRFEVAKAETALLEARFDGKRQLAEQPLHRPAMPGTDWEYWQFQGEFWLDEIGYYRYTLKSGCMKKEE